MNITRETVFGGMSPFMKLLMLLTFIFGGFIISGVIVIAGSMVYGSDGVTLQTISAMTNPRDIAFLKLAQLVNQVFAFVLPALLLSYLVSGGIYRYTGLKREIQAKKLMLHTLIVFVMLPFISFLLGFNEAMHLPTYMSGIESWMRNSEQQAALLTEAFLNTGHYGTLLLNLVVIALLPAIGEELVFRGLLQRFIKEWTGREGIAIIVSAFIFSAVHLQFFGFLPRFVLGIVLGCVFVWTGNLLYPMLVHFVNNALTVCLYFVQNRYGIDVEGMEARLSGHPVVIVLSVLLSIAVLWYIRRGREGIKVKTEL